MKWTHRLVKGNPMQYLHWSAPTMHSNSPLRATSRTIAKWRVNLRFLQRFDSSFHPKFSFRSSAISRCFSGFLWLGLACLASGCMVRRLRSWNSPSGERPALWRPPCRMIIAARSMGIYFWVRRAVLTRIYPRCKLWARGSREFDRLMNAGCGSSLPVIWYFGSILL